MNFNRNLKFKIFNTRFHRASYVVVIFILLQTFLPFWVSANTSSESHIVNSENIIIICSGNELVYLALNKNGDFSKIEAPGEAPTQLQIIHCDSCVFSDATFIPIDKPFNYLPPLDAHRHPILSGKSPLNLHKYRPPLRAPPA
ncbi:MAG: hypothetical protein COB24_09315 [Hyphomicrobiales bacterium]|nr:MAG: hypothetical protein COB24_09315 [Hyphomicrobiales bacterium]